MLVILIVDDVTEDGSKLAEASVCSGVESRLRSARLYSDEPIDYVLEVLVGRFGKRKDAMQFLIGLYFRKTMFDPATGLRFMASGPWANCNRYGTGSPEFVRFSLTVLVDEFLVDYLRINEAACAERQ